MSAIIHTKDTVHSWFNSTSPSAAYMHLWTGLALVQVMACHLFGTKPSPEPVLTSNQFHPCEQITVKFKSKYKSFD